MDNGYLKYQWLGEFDRDMVAITKENGLFAQKMGDLRLNLRREKVLAFYRHGLLFAFNFHPSASQTGVQIPVSRPGVYDVVLCTDDEKYGGFDQIQHIPYPTQKKDGKYFLELYLPARTAVVLKEPPLPEEEEKVAEPVTAEKE